MLKEILKKINLFMIDVLEENNKKEVVVRFILTLTKTQMNNIPLYEKVKYYMNSYEKDSFVLCVDSLAKDIAKYHSNYVDIGILG